MSMMATAMAAAMVAIMVVVVTAASSRAALLPPGSRVDYAAAAQEAVREQAFLDTRKAAPWEREAYVQTGSGWGPEKARQFSGYVNVRPSSDERSYSHLFFWAFESRNAPETAPWLVWLTGGPGCSSMLALFTENGPYMVNETSGGVRVNPYSWNEHANLVFIDQPVGSGYSYADKLDDYVTDEKEVAYQMVEFLTAFKAANGAFAKNDFFLFGESYAGHYVPAVGHAIVTHNARVAAGDVAAGTRAVHIPLKALGIGNGWVDPHAQYGAYAQYAYSRHYINEFEKAAFDGSNKACLALIDSGAWFAALELCSVQMTAVLEAIALHVGYQPNVYDVRIPCGHPPLCYSFDKVSDVLNRADVKASLGVPANRTWSSCSMFVHTMLLGDWVGNFATALPAVLASGVRVVAYSGVEDYVCNYEGGVAWTNALDWPGKAAFNAAPLTPWKTAGKLSGSVRRAEPASSGALEFVEVLGAGHLAPMDKPAQLLDLVDRVLNNKQFNN